MLMWCIKCNFSDYNFFLWFLIFVEILVIYFILGIIKFFDFYIIKYIILNDCVVYLVLNLIVDFF